VSAPFQAFLADANKEAAPVGRGIHPVGEVATPICCDEVDLRVNISPRSAIAGFGQAAADPSGNS
jgi:hypothetical protein